MSRANRTMAAAAFLPVSPLRACECLRDDLAGEVDDGGFDHVVVAEVERDDVAAIRLDAEQRGRLAGAGAGLAPDLGDQARRRSARRSPPRRWSA